MKALLLTAVIALAASNSVADERVCKSHDDDLLECPVVELPLVTELREGFVELAYTVQPDGSVTDIRVIKFGGDKRWIDAAVSAVSQWKYRAVDQSIAKTQRFVFEFGE